MHRTVLSALLVLIFIAGLMLVRVERIAETFKIQVQHLTEEVHSLAQRVAPIGNEMSTTYPSTGGPHTVSTPYQTGETAENWRARHASNVAAAQAGEWPLVLPE